MAVRDGDWLVPHHQYILQTQHTGCRRSQLVVAIHGADPISTTLNPRLNLPLVHSRSRKLHLSVVCPTTTVWRSVQHWPFHCSHIYTHRLGQSLYVTEADIRGTISTYNLDFHDQILLCMYTIMNYGFVALCHHFSIYIGLYPWQAVVGGHVQNSVVENDGTTIRTEKMTGPADNRPCLDFLLSPVVFPVLLSVLLSFTLALSISLHPLIHSLWTCKCMPANNGQSGWTSATELWSCTRWQYRTADFTFIDWILNSTTEIWCNTKKTD